MTAEGDSIMKAQRKAKAAIKKFAKAIKHKRHATKKFAKTIKHKRHATKLDHVLAARGIKG